MSATRGDEIMLSFKSNIEYTLFNKDGIVSKDTLEQVGSCISEPNEIFGKKMLVFTMRLFYILPKRKLFNCI